MADEGAMRIGRLSRLVLLAALLALMSPSAGRAVPTNASPQACEPFCGVARFMKPAPRVAVRHAPHPTEHRFALTRRNSVPVAHVVPMPPPYGFVARRLPYYVVVYPGYGYAYYYYYPYAYGGY